MLKAEKITKEFKREVNGSNRFIAVKETSLQLEPGTLTVIMGRSGSGKSTLMNMLGGLILPTSGSVFLGDVNLYELSDKKLSELRNKKIGIIPQGQTAIHSLSVKDNICLPCTLYQDDENTEENAEKLMDVLGISELKNAMPSELSGGELRRTAIARALIRNPEIVLADEPTGDLDDENTELVFEFLKQTAKSGTAVLMITHENIAEKYADKVYRMNGGILESV